jgi:hypothetical protein
MPVASNSLRILLLDLVGVLAGFHAPDRLLHVVAQVHAGGIEQPAHQPGGLLGVVLVDALHLPGHGRHGLLEPGLVDVPERVAFLVLRAPLGDREQ